MGNNLIELRRRIMAGSPNLITKTGSLLTLKAIARPLSSCVLTLTPKQSGTGDPSPDNIRPISGVTGDAVYVSAYTPGTPQFIQDAVKSGYGADLYPVGSQITVPHSTLGDVIFDVVDHRTVNNHPRMVLLMHNCVYNRPIDAIEALYFAENGLEAGTYHFTIQNYDATYGGNKTYQFTLTDAVPSGGYILLDWPYNQQLLGRSVKTYASKTATTQIESAVLSEGNSGTDLGTTDGTSTNLNHIHRARYGSNNYAESAIRQWINSNATANNWWTSQTKFDLAPAYANQPGLLNGFGEDFLSVIQNTVVKCGTNNTFELPEWTKNTAYTVTDKFYLPSRPEVGLGDESMDQGSVWRFYDGAAGTDWIKRDFGSTARNWWLRSPHPSNASYVRLVNSSGEMSYTYAYYGTSAAAACEIG